MQNLEKGKIAAAGRAMKAREMMTAAVVSVAPDTTTREAARIRAIVESAGFRSSTTPGSQSAC